MRTHGWSGAPPETDAEAVVRITEAAHRCILTIGANTTISEVANDLGVSRQTVYRYFPSTESLLMAAARSGTKEFLQRLALRLRPISDPGEAIVEAVAYTIGQVDREPYLTLLLGGTKHSLVKSVTSQLGRETGRELLEQTSVDWAAAGLSSRDLDDLSEWTLRTLQTFLVDPGEPVRSPAQLRAFLRRWLAPSLDRKRVPS